MVAKWSLTRTVLIVGEGYAEVAFLQHVKRLLNKRGDGLAVRIGNARGKGARHVVEWTGRQAAVAAYDKVASLLDTDTDWAPEVVSMAAKHRIQLLKSEPCLEALLLRVLGERARGNSRALKRQLAAYIGDDATQPESYEKHFSLSALQACRRSEPTIDALLGLFGR